MELETTLSAEAGGWSVLGSRLQPLLDPFSAGPPPTMGSSLSPVLEAGLSDKQSMFFSIGTKARNLTQFQLAKENLFQPIPTPQPDPEI